MEKRRLEQVIRLMQERGLPALLVTHPVNRRYVTGFTGTSGYVLITHDRACLLTDFRYVEQAEKQAEHVEVIEHGPDVKEEIRQKLEEWNIRSLAFEQQHLNYGDYTAYARALEGVELLPTDGLVEQVRMKKDDRELEIMKQAARLADETYTHVLNILKPGVSEKDIALELEFYMRHHGADSSSFDMIVASGERSALPHGTASDRVIGNNEFVKMDFGAYYNGYCSDLTRTVVVGNATEKQRDLYHIVLEAQMHALEHLRPGMTGREADELARQVIRKYGYGDRFGHGTGHGLGMEIHEAPRLSPKGDVVLEPGMTVTVEPGIYLPGYGGVRIEDDVVITENGAERLTHSDKTFLEIH